MNLHQKLVEMRKQIDVFIKDTRGYNYSYVSGSQVLEKIDEKKNELGILLYPTIDGDKVSWETFDYQVWNKKREQMENRTDFVISGSMTYVWQNADEPSDKLEIPFMIFGMQDDISKAFGSGLTYSERYFLLKFFNIPTDDEDPDKRQGGHKRGTSNKASSKQLDFVDSLLDRNVSEKYTKDQLYQILLQKMGTSTEMKDWTSKQASQAIKILQGDNK